MRLIGKPKLNSVLGCSSEIDRWIAIWSTELTHANWRASDDVFEAFPRARLLNDNYFAFAVDESEYRIRVGIFFDKGTALILEVYKDE